MRASKVSKRVSHACCRILSADACICMEQLCLNTETNTHRHESSSLPQPDPASLLSWVMWMCYDTLCRHAKLNRGSHRRNHTYLNCDFHCFIYGGTWRASAWDTLTRTHIRTFTRLYHWKCRACIMYPCFFHIEQHGLVSPQVGRYCLDTLSLFRHFFICIFFFFLCLSHDGFVLKPSTIL